jgi:serine protease
MALAPRHGSVKETRMRHLGTALIAVVFGLGTAQAQGFPPLGAAPDPAAGEAVLLDLQDDVSEAELEALELQYGIRLSYNSLHSRAAKLLRVDELSPSRGVELISALAGDPRVETVEAEQTYQVVFEPDDPLYRYQWHFQQVRMPEAWEVSSGKGVVVAVIDTGVAYEDYEDKSGKYRLVEDLKGVRFVPGYDFVDNDEHANDDHCHGTHVAGTIAQATNNGVGVAGMAHKASIMPLKVLSAQGFGKTADIADAIRFAADHGAHVINMSLGGPMPSKILRDAIHYAHKKGVVVVAAAGNNGQRKVSYPAAYPDTIAVSATRYDRTLTWYSNWGPEIDLAAPGGDTRVDQNGDGYPDGVLQNTIAVQDPQTEGYFLFQGTSMASPHVAAAAALVMAQGVTDPDKVEAILKATAQKQGSEDFEEHYGYGIVDAAAAASKASEARRTTSLLLAGLGTLALAGLGLFLRGRGAGYVLGLLSGSAGVLFPLRSQLDGALAVLSHGVGSWSGLLFGPDGYSFPLVLSALLPFGLTALLFGIRPLRAFLAGLSVGFGASLLGESILGYLDVAYVPNLLGSFLDRAWLLFNGLASFLLGALLLKACRRP